MFAVTTKRYFFEVSNRKHQIYARTIFEINFFLSTFTDILQHFFAILDTIIVRTQYKLDFSGLSGRSTSGNARDEEGNSGMQGSDSKGSATSEGSMWQYGMRRGKGDARRTRVSFLLF